MKIHKFTYEGARFHCSALIFIRFKGHYPADERKEVWPRFFFWVFFSQYSHLICKNWYVCRQSKWPLNGCDLKGTAKFCAILSYVPATENIAVKSSLLHEITKLKPSSCVLQTCAFFLGRRDRISYPWIRMMS